MLVATDVAAGGLDIVGLDAVINVDVTPTAEQHIHRVGSTGQLQGRELESAPLDGLTPTRSGSLLDCWCLW